MKRTILLLTAAMMLLSSMPLFAGNGAPNGSHFTLNIIGVPKAKKAAMDDSNRRSLFVPLAGKCQINLGQGPFNVADGNCFDGDGARFTLPDPDPDGDGTTAYSVYARALGKPGGRSVTTSCYSDADGARWCSTENVVLVRTKGKQSFSNVSRELLTVCVDEDLNGSCDRREFLFDDSGHSYYWDYDNTGLRVAQLRFYEIPSAIGLTP